MKHLIKLHTWNDDEGELFLINPNAITEVFQAKNFSLVCTTSDRWKVRESLEEIYKLAEEACS